MGNYEYHCVHEGHCIKWTNKHTHYKTVKYLKKLLVKILAFVMLKETENTKFNTSLLKSVSSPDYTMHLLAIVHGN